MPVDLIDLTDLKRRGLFKETPDAQTEKPDYVDFSSPTKQLAQTNSPNPLSFLDTFAANSPPNQTTQTDTQDLNIKLENLEYKLERLTEKLALIENKLQNFEDKAN